MAELVRTTALLLLFWSTGSAWMHVQVPTQGAARLRSSVERSTMGSLMHVSRREVLFLAGSAGLGHVLTGDAQPVVAAEDQEFTLSFNVSKGSLGIRLQELRYPRQSGFFGGKTFEAVIVSSVDPSGQGVKQAKGQVRPGVVVKAVQGRKLEGLKAKDAIKQLEDEIRARSDPEGLALIKAEGLPELVEITFSTECVSTPSEPDICYNSVMPIESVLGVQGP